VSQGAGLRLLCATAHPDDECLGLGGTIARYAAEGVEVALVVGTRGERGRFGDGSEPHPGPERMGEIREGELRAAADVLGVRHVRFLGYLDGELDRADPREAVCRVAGIIRELRPHVVVTFDPYGGYGHPDHIAVSQLATAAVVRAASAAVVQAASAAVVQAASAAGVQAASAAGRAERAPGSGASATAGAATAAGAAGEPHVVQKLYYMAWTERVWSHYQRIFKVLRTTLGEQVRSSVAWPDWSVTTTADAHDHWETVWAAVQCHRTQMAQYGALERLTPEDHRGLWGPQECYRVFSLVNGGRERESDLFEGLR
jgi:LmbE family N-acetylglucosaminyl deacetylase